MHYAKYTKGDWVKLVVPTKVFPKLILKRFGNLYEKIISKENIELAYQKARRGKTCQRAVKRVDNQKEAYLDALHESLKNKTFRTSPYKEKIIYEPKLRTIYILPFYPDRIVQHAIMNIIEPIWNSRLIFDTYACRKNKGQHAGSKRSMQFVKRNKYCLKCDISKFYPSVNHDILFEIVKRKIKCPDTLNLLKEIITSVVGEKNVPIGNYLSQWFGNIYMGELDQVMKHKYKIRDYIRYCDDFLLFSNDKKFLRQLQVIIPEYLAKNLKLKMSKCDLIQTTQGIDFLGYRHFPQGYILVRKTTAKRIKRRIKALPWKVRHGIITPATARSVIASTSGWLKWANAHHFSIALKLAKLLEEVNAYK